MAEHSEETGLRRSANCGRCGRFVGPRNFNAVFDDYAGGWEWDPMCDDCERPAVSELVPALVEEAAA